MQPSAYIRRETAVSIVINLVLSALFFMAVFGRSGSVPVWGVGSYVFDFGPQGFMIALMATLVPGLLARKARTSGKVVAMGGAARLPANIAVRAMFCGLLGAATGMAGSALVLAPWGVTHLDWLTALLAKLAFGGTLAAVVTPAGLQIGRAHV